MSATAANAATRERRARLAETLTAALQRRRAEMGDADGGLYNYYALRVESGDVFSFADRMVADHLDRMRGSFKRVWDIGAGVGQLALLLAFEGHSVVAVDQDRRRFAAIQALTGAVGTIDGDIATRIDPIMGRFPEAIGDRDVSGDVAVALGCAYTAPEEDHEKFRAGLAAFSVAIVDVGQLCTLAASFEECDARARQLADAYGLVDQYHLFDQQDPGGRWKSRIMAMRRRRV